MHGFHKLRTTAILLSSQCKLRDAKFCSNRQGLVGVSHRVFDDLDSIGIPVLGSLVARVCFQIGQPCPRFGLARRLAGKLKELLGRLFCLRSRRPAADNCYVAWRWSSPRARALPIYLIFLVDRLIFLY